jgi:hypothetical protein
MRMENKPWRRPRPTQGCSASKEEEEDICIMAKVRLYYSVSLKQHNKDNIGRDKRCSS